MPRWLGMDRGLEFLGPVSDFATELAQESGRLRELLRLGIMAALPQAGSPGSGLQATPFVGTPSGEPIGELPNLEFSRMGRAPGPGLGDRLLVVELSAGGRRRRGLYSDSNEISVPKSLIFFIAYHTAVSHHAVRGPCGETRLPLSDVDLAHLTCVRSAVRPLTPSCLCQAGFPMSGRPRWRANYPRAQGRAHHYWEEVQRLEAAIKAKADAEAKKRKLKASRHKKRTHSGSDYDSESDSSDSERKYRKKRIHKKHRKHDQSDSEDGGKRKHRSTKRSSSFSDHDSSDDDDAGRKRHTHGRKYRCSSGTDSSSSPSSSDNDEKKANRKGHSRHHKHHHRSDDEDSTSDSQARRRHSKHKHHLRLSEDDSSSYDDHKHNRISSQGKSSGEEYETGKPRNAKKLHRKHGHHHHNHQKHNHHRSSVEPDVELGTHQSKTSADGTSSN
ncbi:hypothetical protein BHM03_00050501 [Ensete ventricosum]|nr:hypothetical protein BHM03_00050501 [Ensete ventricosum]